jgi:hypothetical protein
MTRGQLVRPPRSRLLDLKIRIQMIGLGRRPLATGAIAVGTLDAPRS